MTIGSRPQEDNTKSRLKFADSRTKVLAFSDGLESRTRSVETSER